MDFKITHLEQVTSIKEFDDKYLKVYRSDGLCTLFDTKTLKYAFEKWFKDIFDFSDDYYLVQREDELQNLIKKSDGEFVNEELWYEKWDIERFTSIYLYPDYLFAVYKQNKCTLLRKNLTFVCKDKWATSWNWFEGNLLMRRDDKHSTIVSIKDGSYMYDNIWFASWENFSSNYYLVETSKRLKTLISKKDGSFAYNDLFAYEIYNFGDKFLTFKNKKYGTFLYSKDLKEVNGTKFKYKSSSPYDIRDIILLEIYKSDKIMLAKYDENTEEYKFISNCVFKSNFTFVCKEFYRCEYVSFTKVNELTCTVVRDNGAKVVLDSIAKIEPYEYSNSLYLVTREDGKKTMFNGNTDSYVNKDAWFVYFTEIGDYPEVFLVTREDGLKTIVNKSDLSYVFDDRWFEKWDNAYPKYYLVSNGDKINFVNKTDGSLLFGKDSKKKENVIIYSNWAINKFTVYVLEYETLRVYNIT